MVDVDRFFRDKDLEELTRKTYDNMGLEVRDVLVKSDLYEGGQEPAQLLPRRRKRLSLRRADSGEREVGLLLDGHDAAQVRSRRLRQVHQPQALLLLVDRGPHVYTRGRRADDGLFGGRSGLALGRRRGPQSRTRRYPGAHPLA